MSAELTLLLACLLFVACVSLCSKTSCVDEMHKHIVKTRGLWARAKFHKHETNSLFAAFRQLVTSLQIQDALTWRVRLLRALHGNGALLCDVIPELSRLLGEQPPVAKLSPAAAASRFNTVFLQFVCALATELSPLTLFIDDPQVSRTTARMDCCCSSKWDD